MSVLSRLFSSESRALTSAEIRDPRAANQSLTYARPDMRQIAQWDAQSAINDAYLSSVVVYACVQTRAYALAGCPLRAVLPGQKIENHDPNAPLARLLGPAPGGPNQNMASRALWRWSHACKITTGRVAWELEQPLGASSKDFAPVGLWPLVMTALDPYPSLDGVELFEYFKYGRGSFENKVTLKPEQVFYSFTTALTDLRQAESPLQAVRYDIVSDVLQAVYNVAFLRNDSRPSGILIHQAFEEAAERRAFEQQFDANHRGPQNANRVAFAEVEPGDTDPTLKWVQMGLSQRDAQSIAARADSSNRICIALRTPMGLLDASNRTFSNASEEVQNWWLDTMLPDVADWEDEINLKIAPRLGKHVAKFDTSHVRSLQPPARFTSMSLTEAYDRKLIDDEEARSEMGFAGTVKQSGFDSGSTMTEQAQLITALGAAGWDPKTIATIVGIAAPPDDALPKSAPPSLPASPLPPAGASAFLNSATLSATRQLRQEKTRAEQRLAAWRAADAQTRSAEGVWLSGVRRLFLRQLTTTLARLRSRWVRWLRDPHSANPDEVFDPVFQRLATVDAMTGLFEALFAASGARVAAQHGFAFNVVDPKVMALIEMRVSKLAEQVTATTYDDIRSVILSGVANGSDIATVSKGIETVFAEADSTRATMIARTETIAAAADGALASYRQAVDSGVLDGYGKVWIATPDERECPMCQGLAGERRTFDETFSDGQEGPPDHPNCRCAIGAEPLDPSDRSLHADDVRVILRAIGEGSLKTEDLVA